MSDLSVEALDGNSVAVWNSERTFFYRVGDGIFGCAVELYRFDPGTGIAHKEAADETTVAKTIEAGIDLAKKLIAKTVGK